MLTFHGNENWTRDTDNDMRMVGEVASHSPARGAARGHGRRLRRVGVRRFIQRRPTAVRLFTIAFGCAPENVDKLEKAVFDEIAAIQKKGIGQDYIDKIKELRRRAHETELKENGYWLHELERVVALRRRPEAHRRLRSDGRQGQLRPHPRGRAQIPLQQPVLARRAPAGDTLRLRTAAQTMRRLLLLGLVLVACGSARSSVVSAPEPVVDAAVDSGVDASPPDAAVAVAEAAAPELPKPVCWASQPNGPRTEAMRVRVRDGNGDDIVNHDGKSWQVGWADLDIVEVLRGDMTKVSPRFRRSLYVSGTGSFCHAGGVRCGEAHVSNDVLALVAAKGQERVVVVTLPPIGSTGGPIPPKLRAKYGDARPMLYRVCPVVAGEGEPFPPIDDACTVDADCTTSGLFGTCCGNCEERYTNQAYVARARVYCARYPPPACPPMGCSWGMAKPQCVGGHCQARKP